MAKISSREICSLLSYCVSVFCEMPKNKEESVIEEGSSSQKKMSKVILKTRFDSTDSENLIVEQKKCSTT